MSAPSEIPDDENEDEEYPPDEMRKPAEVAARCVVLLGVIAAGYEQPRAEIFAWLRGQSLWSAVSPNEAAFLQSDTPTQQQIVNATWRTEALHALLWSLDRMPALCPPTQRCDLDSVREAMPDLYADTSDFISSALLRDEDTIEDFRDVYDFKDAFEAGYRIESKV